MSQEHSKYWLDQELFTDEADSGDRPEGTDLQKIARLAAVRRAIANFVAILSGKNIPVRFSSGRNSYTDGESVVIAADEDPSKFDVMVGLALHEGSHVLLTDFEHLRMVMKAADLDDSGRYGLPNLWVEAGRALWYSLMHPVVAEQLGPCPKEYTWAEIGQMSGQESDLVEAEKREWQGRLRRVLEDLRTVMNILEDRRIDQYVFQRAGGYRPYYMALYNRYFFTADIGKNLRFNPKWREVTVENYLDRMLFMIHPDARPDALPGLEQLYRLVDLPTIERVGEPAMGWKQNIVLEEQPRLWQDANLIYAYILKFAKLGQMAQEEQMPAEGEGAQPEGMPGEMPPHMDGLPNLDGQPQRFEPVPVEQDTKGKGKKQRQVEGKYNQKKAENQIKSAKQVMAGEARKKKISKQEDAAVSAMEAADAKLMDITGDGVPFGKCMVTRKMTPQLLDQEWFIFRNRWNWESGRAREESHAAVAAGKRMGQILLHRLQVRNDPMVTKQTRLPQGGLDRRMLAQLGMDITSVFQKSRTDQHRPAMLHLTLDASGSMSGRKWQRVRTVAVALAYLGSKLRNVDTVISIRGGNEMPVVAVIYDSRRDQFPTFCRYIKFIEPAGATPEGLCFKATMDLITESKSTHDVYFINFSDGEPGFSYTAKSALDAGKTNRLARRWEQYFNYSGDIALRHTRKMVRQMREQGIKVLSYYISDYAGGGYSHKAFTYMYEQDAAFCNVENAVDVLRTLNKLLLKRGA